MTEQKLCKKCCQWVVLNYGPNYYTPPYTHCHHDEPEEKPKVKCWCEEPTFSVVVVLSREKKTTMARVNFCPICGKPRKDWGK